MLASDNPKDWSTAWRIVAAEKQSEDVVILPMGYDHVVLVTLLLCAQMHRNVCRRGSLLSTNVDAEATSNCGARRKCN